MRRTQVPWAVRFSVIVGAIAVVLFLAYFGIEVLRGNVDLGDSTEGLDRYVTAVIAGDASTAGDHLCQRIRDELEGSEVAFQRSREATLAELPDGVDEVLRLSRSGEVATIRLRLNDSSQEVRYLQVVEEANEPLFCPVQGDALLGSGRRPSR